MQDGSLKPIVTVYDGYRFRSRLEARHAVLFNELGVKYAYEDEGYVLEGIPYLPDFWLPDLDCYVEVKGMKPTEEERHKARLLALYSQKSVFTFYGNIETPDFTIDRLSSYHDAPPSLWTGPKSHWMIGSFMKKVEAPSDLLALLQKLHSHHIRLSVASEGELVVSTLPIPYGIDAIDAFLDNLQRQQNAVREFEAILVEKEEELQALLTPADGWKFHLETQPAGLENDCLWAECETCGHIEITTPFADLHICEDGKAHQLSFDSPRLIAAYTAARQARFEHGEKPKGRQQ